jgi:lipopolysaccharide transport system permease protein
MQTPTLSAHASASTSRSTPSAVTVVIRPNRGLFDLDLASLWEFREILYFLVWRDIKLRYKQTAIGVAWAVLQPLATMAIFAVIFGHLAKIPSDGLPYAIFAFTGLLPWIYFSQAIARSGASVVSDANLIKKVYFPRLLIPIAAILSPLVDFLISFVFLLGMVAWFGIRPGWNMLALPLFLALAMITALAAGLWLSALNVKYRDVGHTLPFLIQIWLYASPVAYSVTLIPEKWRPVYGLNPMAGAIEGFRWALLHTDRPALGVIAMSAVAVLALLIGGVIFFKNFERSFADVI